MLKIIVIFCCLAAFLSPTISAASEDECRLVWDASQSKNVVAYKVYLDGQRLETVEGLSYLVGVKPCALGRYTVAAVNVAGVTSTKSEGYIVDVPKRPTGLTVLVKIELEIKLPQER